MNPFEHHWAVVIELNRSGFSGDSNSREDGVMERQGKYSPEVKERAVRMVFDQQHQHESQWSALSSIAQKVGCTSETLRKWVRQAERDTGQRAGLTTARQLDGTDALEDSSALDRLSQTPCRVGWSLQISRTPLGFELSAPFAFSDTTRPPTMSRAGSACS